jgi:hypothetical protein
MSWPSGADRPDGPNSSELALNYAEFHAKRADRRHEARAMHREVVRVQTVGQLPRDLGKAGWHSSPCCDEWRVKWQVDGKSTVKRSL